MGLSATQAMCFFLIFFIAEAARPMFRPPCRGTIAPSCPHSSWGFVHFLLTCVLQYVHIHDKGLPDAPHLKQGFVLPIGPIPVVPWCPRSRILCRICSS